MPNDGKERKEQKINLRQRRTRQTARERGPDAAWEGYLIYDITPLFPFSLPLLLHSSLPLTSLRVSARAQTIFALSPPYPGTTSPPTVPTVLPFNPEGLFFLYDPTINEAISPKKKKKCKSRRWCTCDYGLDCKLMQKSLEKEEIGFSLLCAGPTTWIPKGQTSPQLPLTLVLLLASPCSFAHQ